MSRRRIVGDPEGILLKLALMGRSPATTQRRKALNGLLTPEIQDEMPE
jgi:hypothetical protein